jgi:hypothetical protein
LIAGVLKLQLGNSLSDGLVLLLLPLESCVLLVEDEKQQLLGLDVLIDVFQ